MKRKVFSILLALVLALSLSLVMAVPVPVMAEEEGTNYDPFGEVVYIWGADGGGLANVMKWFYLGTQNGGDGDGWDSHQITIVNSQWPEFNGQWYLENTGVNERFTLWADWDGTTFTNRATTANTGLIGDWDNPAAYAIDGWVEFDPAIDSVGDPRETVGELSHMYYGSSAGSGGLNLEVKLNTFGAPDSFDGRYLDLVESGWEDINGGWFLKFVLDAGGGSSGWYELYADVGFTEPGIPDDPDKFVQYGGTEGYLYANSGRFVEPGTAVLSMTAASEAAVIGISVSPTSINFGAITAGATRDGPSLTVANIGNVPVTVDVEITADTFYDTDGNLYFYTKALKLNEVPSDQESSPSTMGKWSATALGLDSIAVGQSGSVSTKVVCPSPIEAGIVYTGTVVFWAEAPGS